MRNIASGPALYLRQPVGLLLHWPPGGGPRPVDARVGAPVEAAEAKVGAVGVGLAGAPAVGHGACKILNIY